jgi:hypothetical protein
LERRVPRVPLVELALQLLRQSALLLLLPSNFLLESQLVRLDLQLHQLQMVWQQVPRVLPRHHQDQGHQVIPWCRLSYLTPVVLSRGLHLVL